MYRLVTAFLVTAAMTAVAAQGAVQPGQGGGDGGGGATPRPTAPPGGMCYLSGGWGSNFGLFTDEHGTKATLDAKLPGGDWYKEQTRVVTTGADGSMTYDSGWLDETPYGDWLSGGQTVGETFTIAGNPDMSGGFTITNRFTNGGGESHDAYGMTFPPDPVVNSC